MEKLENVNNATLDIQLKVKQLEQKLPDREAMAVAAIKSEPTWEIDFDEFMDNEVQIIPTSGKSQKPAEQSTYAKKKQRTA